MIISSKRFTLRIVGGLFIISALLISPGSSTAQKQSKRGHHHDLKQFEKFLEQHPSIAGELSKDPAVAANPDYLARNPELKEFLTAHPGLIEEIRSKIQRCSLSTPSIFDRASPAVVYTYATSINPYRATHRVEHVIGSGFIFDSSGLVLTNSHVAFPRQSLIVGLEDGTSLPAQLVGADPIFDVAVLRIENPPKSALPALSLGDSDLVHVGGEAIAIGNPLGLDQTLTRGTVSAVNRVLPATFFSFQEPLIQIDTPINPGNSGGPLLNQCGEVVGITTAMVQDAQNIGFAIPSNLVKAMLPSLLNKGHVIRPWLGFHGQPVNSDLEKLLRIPLATGFLVEVVEPGSPAEKSGLKGGQLEMTIAGHELLLGGDIITKMNGFELNSTDNVIAALEKVEVGSTVNLNVFRLGKDLEISYTVTERPLLPGDIAGQALSVSATSFRPLNSFGRTLLPRQKL